MESRQERQALAIAALFRASLDADVLEGIHLCGSRACGTNTSHSDFDIALILHGTLSQSIQSKIAQVSRALGEFLPVPLDIIVLDSASLALGVRPDLKVAKRLYGADALDRAGVLARPDLLIHYGRSVFRKIRAVRGNTKKLLLPLQYPKADSPFFGYETFGVLRPGGYREGFHSLMDLTAAIATFRLAFLAGIYPTSKREVVKLYASHLASDQWAELIRGLFALCLDRFEATVPTSQTEQTQLVRFCAEILSMENDFTDLYSSVKKEVSGRINPVTAKMVDAIDGCLARSP